MNKKPSFIAFGIAFVSLVFVAAASAEDFRSDNFGHRPGLNFSHAGGFVCGELANTNNRILGGDHRTHFNIRNGSKGEVTVDLEMALGFPAADPAANGASFTPGATTVLQSVTLKPGEAVMIDCDELITAALLLDVNPPPYFSGILDARSKRPLQVTRTQTAGPNGEDVRSLSVTEIQAISDVPFR
ncbi:MAG TPA: hypothetical protein PKK23_21070 [Nitrospirales bacterium]|nr:hypothetical protein [Nitrospiraceae bacterium]HNP31551.1 hypothetical protein [Nitrospirales bacterium]